MGKKPNDLKGFGCPSCQGIRLGVTKTRAVARGVVVRYRKCSACGHTEITEERPATTRKPRSGKELSQ